MRKHCKWFAKFYVTEFSLNKYERPVDYNQMKTLLENNQHYMTWKNKILLTKISSRGLQRFAEKDRKF